ncbi:ribosome maturation factor RimP [Nocardioides sp. GY 10113]|uniref:ribosome maturation factor RimP n=1 Tax=Nocardioides sp. GY 10113 TaxID=2569761 RepID=UPI0010A8D46C|nr:ribosome maturation factor RimP [Nocardioides sp. GY 10113]TIC88734.1 ribosome maturation factor RimP [Nocardioides sp. GY 10113]
MSSSRSSADRDAARIESLIGGEGGRLAELGIDVEAVEITPAGKRRVLRVAVDKDGGVTLDDVATATKLIDAAIEETDVMGEQPYTLEVTSRGVDRPLTLPRHWRRNAGRLVKATLGDGRVMTGRVLDSDEGGVTLDVEGERVALSQTEITKALVQIEFNRKDDH